MSQRGLEALLRPQSIAVIGASEKPNRAGSRMMSNLLSGGFAGPVLPVTPSRRSVQGYWHIRLSRICRWCRTWPLSAPTPNVILPC